MTSRVLSFGTMCRGMKKIVSVPFARPGIPCASHPSSFPYEWVHVALVLGFAIVGVYIVMVCPWTDHILARNLLLKVEADLS